MKASIFIQKGLNFKFRFNIIRKRSMKLQMIWLPKQANELSISLSPNQAVTSLTLSCLFMMVRYFVTHLAYIRIASLCSQIVFLYTISRTPRHVILHRAWSTGKKPSSPQIVMKHNLCLLSMVMIFFQLICNFFIALVLVHER